jgi:hypothetical protein
MKMSIREIEKSIWKIEKFIWIRLEEKKMGKRPD